MDQDIRISAGQAGTTQEPAMLLQRQRAASTAAGPPDLRMRLQHLDALANAVRAYRDRLVAAVTADFGHRSWQETTYLDIMPVITSIGYLKRNLRRWMRPQSRRIALHFLPGSTRVEFQPLGVIGIISPWNYPIVLALTPLATALAAGNRVMLKPSEITPRTSDVLASLIAETFSPRAGLRHHRRCRRRRSVLRAAIRSSRLHRRHICRQVGDASRERQSRARHGWNLAVSRRRSSSAAARSGKLRTASPSAS